MNKNRNNKNRNVKICIALAILLALLVVLAIVLKSCMYSSKSSDIEPGVIDIDNESMDDIQSDVDDEMKNSMFNAFINTNITLDNGNSKANLLIQNIETNPGTIFVEIYNLDNDELVYKSDNIPVGFKIEYAKFNRHLDKGYYRCIAYFNILDDDNNVTSRIGVNVNVTVKN